MKKIYSVTKNREGRLIAAAVVVLSLTLGTYFYGNAYTPKTNSITVIGNKTILDELTKLLIAQNITQYDLQTLDGMVKTDPAAEDSMNEVRALIRDGQYVHVGHELGFIYTYIATGKEVICPPHLISHFYIFHDHNQTNMADDSFQKAMKQFPEWTEKSRQIYNTNEINTLINITNSYIQLIKNGNYTISDSDVSFLSTAGCVNP